MNIVILDDYQDVVRQLACFELLKSHQVQVLTETYPEQELVDKLQHADAIILIRERTPITKSLLNQLPNLKAISQTGKVSNHIDPTLCAQYGVKVLEGRGSPVAPSELCWALIMAASRHLPSYIEQLKLGKWQSSGRLGLGRRLEGLTLGIWGYGKIGQRIAQYGKAFGMSVLVWGSESSRLKAEEDGYQAAESKHEFFKMSDVLSLHLRLNQHTQGCVTKYDLSLMKKDALFVNISRAELIETGALYDELCRVPTKQAALDVFSSEPADSTSEPLLKLENVVATPHLGYVEQSSYELYFRLAFENAVRFDCEEHA